MSILSFLIYHIKIRLEFGPAKMYFAGTPYQQWKQSWAFGANLIFIELNVRLPLLLIEWILNSKSVGIYGIIQRLESIIEIVMINFVKIAFPTFSRYFSEEEKFNQSWKWPWLMTLVMLILSIMGAVIISIFAEKIVTLFIGETSKIAIQLLVITVWAKAISLTKRPLYVALLAWGKERLMSAVNFLMVIVTLLGNLTLLSAIGLIGAAFTYLGSEIIAISIIIVISFHLTKIYNNIKIKNTKIIQKLRS